MRKSLILSLAVASIGPVSLISSSDAAVIYSDTLVGSGALNGVAVSTSNAIAGGTAGATWVGNTINSAPSKTASGAQFADADSIFLAFTPQSGNVYELTATLSTVGGSWTAIGFSDTSGSNTGGSGVWHASAGGGTKVAWALDTAGGAVQFFAGPNVGNGGPVIGSGGNGVPVTVTLDTTAANWQTFVTIGATSSIPFTYTTNPTIGFLGFGNAAGSTTSTVTDFSLSTVVPEPASLGLLSLGGLALLRRRR